MSLRASSDYPRVVIGSYRKQTQPDASAYDSVNSSRWRPSATAGAGNI